MSRILKRAQAALAKAEAWTRGNVKITVSPSGKVMLYAPGSTTEHTSVEAAKREASSRRGRGW